jgi:hypothetical protein
MPAQQQAVNVVRYFKRHPQTNQELQDLNKKKRISMWVAFVISLITIPVFYYYDNRQISETELLTIDNLTLSKNPDYTGGKRPRINIYLTSTNRTLVVNVEELGCVDKDEIINTLKTSDTISIKIFKSDKADFYETGFLSKFQKIYGLNKDGNEYIKVSCRNLISTKRTNGAMFASQASAILSLFLIVFVYRKKTNKPTNKFMNIDPITLVCLCWFLALLIYR